jgi:predicted ATPase
MTAAVADLLRALDGLPLAIELAAARLRVLGAAHLAAAARAETSRLLDLLATPDSGAESRHRTLRASLTAAWEPLAPWERAALAHCSVFRGGFFPDAALAIVDLAAYSGAPAVLDVLQALRDRSLLNAAPAPQLPGEVRLDLLLAVRAFAAEHLAAEPAAHAAAEARHTAYYVGWAQATMESVVHVRRADRRRFVAERGNLLAAQRRAAAVAPPDARAQQQALLAAFALFQTLEYEGAPLSQRLATLDLALALPRPPEEDMAWRIQLVYSRGIELRKAGRLEEARVALEQALAFARAAGAPRPVAAARTTLGLLAIDAARPAEAREHLGAVLEDVRARGARKTEGVALLHLGDCAFAEARLDEADATHRAALAVHRVVGDEVSEALALRGLGQVAHARGLLDEAVARLDEAAALAPRADNPYLWAQVVLPRAAVERDAGRVGEAHALLQQLLAVFSEVGAPRLEAVSLLGLGHCARAEGRAADARALYARAVELLRGIEAPEPRALALACLGAAVARGVPPDLAEAERCFAEAAGVFAGAPPAPPAPPASLAPLAVTVALYRAAAGLAPPPAGAEIAAAAAVSADARLARRSLAEWGVVAVAAAAAAAPATPAPAPLAPPAPAPPAPDPGALLVARTGRWLRAPGGPPEGVDLGRRLGLSRVLRRLAEERDARPDAALGVDALLAAGWPGEQIRPEAGAMRVWNAIAELRKLGLREVLLRRGDGYLLDPAVRFALLSRDA